MFCKGQIQGVHAVKAIDHRRNRQIMVTMVNRHITIFRLLK